MVTDVCLPISELAGAIAHAREALNLLTLTGGIVGHVGDGNFHVLLMIDMNDVREIQKADEFNELIVMYALERGGTCTGEHGVGIGKQKYQEKEHGKALLVMEKIKQVLDPDGLLNPNKIVKIKSRGGNMKVLETISTIAGKYFAVWVICIAVIAFIIPDPFLVFGGYITILLGVVMFGMGLTLKAVDFKLILTNPMPVIIGVCAQYVIMPLSAF